jgi:flagellar hook-length control protein FliK
VTAPSPSLSLPEAADWRAAARPRAPERRASERKSFASELPERDPPRRREARNDRSERAADPARSPADRPAARGRAPDARRADRPPASADARTAGRSAPDPAAPKDAPTADKPATAAGAETASAAHAVASTGAPDAAASQMIAALHEAATGEAEAAEDNDATEAAALSAPGASPVPFQPPAALASTQIGQSGAGDAEAAPTPSAATAALAAPAHAAARAAGKGDVETPRGPAHQRGHVAGETFAATLDAAAPQSGRDALPLSPAALSGGPAGHDAARPAVPVLAPTPIAMVPVAIGLQAMDGGREFSIRLSPEDLGRVDVTLKIGDDGKIDASLVVDRVETLALLQRDARTLERAFDQAGFTADPGAIRFSLRQDQSSGQPGGGQAAPDGAGAASPLERDAVETAQPLLWRGRIGASGVDIRV